MRLPAFQKFVDDRMDHVRFDIRWYAGSDFNEEISAAFTPEQYKAMMRISSLAFVCLVREYHNWLCEQMNKGDQG